MEYSSKNINLRAFPSVFLICIFAIIAGMICLIIGDLPSRYLFGVLLIIPFAFCFAFDLRKYMLGIFLLLVPVSLNISPFHLNLDSPPPLYHGGPPPTLQIWVSSFPLMALLLMWTMDLVFKRGKLRFTLIDIPALLFIGWSAISVFYSPRPDLSLAMLFRFVVFYIVYLYIVNNVTDFETIHFAVKMLLIGLLLQSVIAMAQYWLHLPFSIGQGGMGFHGGFINQLEVGQVYRVQGTVGQTNTFGFYIAMMLSLALSIFLSRGTTEGKFALLCLCCGSTALLITFSRGAWIGAFLSCLFVGYKLYRRRLIRLKIAPFVAIVVSLVFFYSLIIGSQVYLRVTQSTTGVIADRIKLMKVACEMIKEHPHAGVGLNNFTEVMADYDNTGVSDYFPMPVHNLYLLISAETGLVGLGFFICIIAGIILLNIKGFPRYSDESYTLSVGIAGGVCVFLITHLLDVHIIKYVGGLTFWILLGLMGANYLNSYSPDKPES